jgi:Uma2 family endonuclease
MTAILDIPEVRKRFSPLSVEDYHRLGEYNERGRRTELIRGVVIEKMSKSPLHSGISKTLYDLIASMLPNQYQVRREDPLTLNDSEPEPDISIVLGSARALFRSHPATAELVIEVAVSSPELDRANASLYAEAGIKEYWIVLASKNQVEVYRRPEEGRYREVRMFGREDTIGCQAIPEVQIRVGNLFP